MNRDKVLYHVRGSLAEILTPRLFETERGFQGELLVQLNQRIPESMVQKGTIIEQEHQKTLHEHGLTIRPDIIIHEPFDQQRHTDRSKGNYAVIELKLKATASKAEKDFGKLRSMIEILRYPLAIFINIASTATHIACAPAELKGRLVCFAVFLSNGNVQIVEERI